MFRKHNSTVVTDIQYTIPPPKCSTPIQLLMRKEVVGETPESNVPSWHVKA